MSEARRERAAPRVLGRYAIYDAIASGGMATVHYGRLLGPVGFSRTVAIKRLHPQFAQDPEFVTMFLDEARLAGRIRHPNVVATLDVVASSNEIFLVMDYVHGESLARIIREVVARGQLIPLPIALRLASDALQGLHAAHEARDERGVPLNIVHRDISPQNILVGVDGAARLVDFGVAKAAGQGQTTREGQIKGKLGYMAPEQLRAGRVTRQTDVHAFATVLWEMITGRRLFLGETEANTIAKVVQHVVTPVSHLVPNIPPAVDAVLAKGLAESLETRYATAREMCLALGECGPTASTMQVADWVQSQVHELIETRAQVVSEIESNQDHTSQPKSDPPAKSGNGSAREWVSHLSQADATEARPPLATAPQGSVTSISAVMENVLGQGHRKPWGQLALGTLGVLALVVGLLLWARGQREPAPVAASAPAPPASTSPVPLPSSAMPPAPLAVAPSSPLLSAAPPPPAASAPALPKRAVAAPVRVAPKAPAKHENVFESRE